MTENALYRIGYWFRGRYESTLVAVLGGLATILALVSLRWRVDFDTPLLLYVAHLIDRGYVPYRDVFDVNLPVTYLVNYLVLKLFGQSDLAYRIADLTLLSLLSLVTWWWLRTMGPRVALCGISLFALLYLGPGPLHSLQREYLLLIPLSGALGIAVRFAERRGVRFFWISFLFAVAVLIKPHAVVGLPVLLWLTERRMGGAESARTREGKEIAISVTLAVAGFSIPLLLSILYLVHQGAWPSFLEMVRNYWPLFSDISGEQQVLLGWKAKIEYRFLKLAESLAGLVLLIPASWGFFVGLFRSRLDAHGKRIVSYLGGVAVAFAVYTLLAGRFWAYHWLPVTFCLALLSAFGLVHQADRAASLVLLTVASLQVAGLAVPQLYFSGVHALSNDPAQGVVDELAAFLEENLGPGEKVQPLDWTGGTQNAMLTAQAEPASRFIYTYMFHHHVSDPYIQQLRREFVETLDRVQPRFIIEIHQIWTWVSGWDTSPRFPRLRQWMKSHYSPVRETPKYTIYELKTPQGRRSPAQRLNRVLQQDARGSRLSRE